MRNWFANVYVQGLGISPQTFKFWDELSGIRDEEIRSELFPCTVIPLLRQGNLFSWLMCHWDTRNSL